MADHPDPSARWTILALDTGWRSGKPVVTSLLSSFGATVFT